MTKNEINELFDIPLTTLYDWEKEEHGKNKLYKLLSHIDKKVANKTINKKEETHRIFHILNKNITKEHRYSSEEIKRAFSKKDYSLATPREKIIYSRFFKECDKEDLIDLEKTFHVSKRNIKLIYKDIPERAFTGVSKVWDKRFRISSKKNRDNSIPISTQKDSTEFTKKFLEKTKTNELSNV